MNFDIASFTRTRPVTAWFLYLIFAVYLLTAWQSKSITANLVDSSLADDFVLFGPLLGSWFGPLRIVGAALTHRGIGHLVSNSIMLFLVGREVERLVGSKTMLLIVLGSIIGSGTGIVLFDSTAATVGASGVVYALFGVFAMLSLRQLTGNSMRSIIVLLVVYVIYSFAPGISLFGHLSGLAAGLVMGAGLIKPPVVNQRAGNLTCLGLIAACLVVLGWWITTYTVGPWAALL